MLAVLLTFLALALTANSRLTATQPPNKQLPLIARVNKPYSWSLSPQTIESADGDITYSTSALPPWLSFDPGTLTFSGTPSVEDEGYPRITLTAQDSSDSSVSSTFTLCVSSSSEPTVNLPVSQQFSKPSASLSSVFIISHYSALLTGNPALRLHPRWSFSIGFEYETFISDTNLHYDARRRDGSPLPKWMAFDPIALTVNGVVPNESMLRQPEVVPLSLYVSDQEGYSASTVPFDLIIAEHELSKATETLPSINVTKDAPFTHTFSSPEDFSGILIDGEGIQSSEIVALAIDTSEYGNWLKYNVETRTLSGYPGNNTFVLGESPPLRANIRTAFNQSIEASIYLTTGPSYFSAATLPPIQGTQGGTISFNIKQGFLTVTERDPISVSVLFEPHDIGIENWLEYRPSSGELAGTVPSDFFATRITVTFTVESQVTHSVSHASLPIVFAPPEHTKTGFRPLSSSATAHPKLILGLGITFGVIGGLCVFGGILATARRCARVEDTAIGGEEGRNVWSDQDKNWYGVGLDKNCAHEPSNGNPNSLEKTYNTPGGIQEMEEYLDLGLRRVSERSQSQGSPTSNTSRGVMRKREFFRQLRETVRVVSGRRKVSRQRPIIGQPIPHASTTTQVRGEAIAVVRCHTNPFDEPGLPSHPGSTMMTNSPSASTADHSIPRRRADFAPPRPPFQVHFYDGRQVRPRSKASNTSTAEVVECTRPRSMSICSSKCSTRTPHITNPVTTECTLTRPRLVPFTSASRVPVPRQTISSPGLPDELSPSKRIVSQTAQVWKGEMKDATTKGENLDELRMGLHYVESLGVVPQTSRTRPG